jgi:hypothetical protein
MERWPGALARLVLMPGGRVVGGSSATNGATPCAAPDHYDQWANYAPAGTGPRSCPGSGARARPRLPEAPYGAEGPIAISRYPRERWFPLQERRRRRARGGPPGAGGPQRPGALGVGAILLNMIDGVRQTPPTAT